MKVLRQVFRGKLVAGLRAAFHQGRLWFPGALQSLAAESAFRAFLRSLYRQSWVVYAKPPFSSPAHVLHYLARYTHRVAISNHRLVAVTDDTVSFRWKDYRHGSQIRTLTLDADEFLRRLSSMCCRSVRPHPLLWLPRLTRSYPGAGPLSSGARGRPNTTGRTAHHRAATSVVAVPSLRGAYAHRRTPNRATALR